MRSLLRFYILFWLATDCLSKSGIISSNDSDAEEEEEKAFTDMHENETFFMNTLSPPENFSFPKPLLEDLLDTKREENVWWENDTNFTDYDESNDEKKIDASPENNIDRSMLQNVNFFLPDSFSTDSSSIVDFKRDLSLENKSSTVIDETLTSLTPSKVTKTSFVQTTCNFGDRKCTATVVESTDELNFTSTKDILTTSSTFPITAPEERLLLFEANETSVEIPTFSTNLKILSDYTTPFNIESTTVQTSDNIIWVEGAEVNKDESVIRGQLSKNEKSRQLAKQRENTSDLEEDKLARTFPETTEMTPDILLVKESISTINTPIYPSSVLSKLFSAISTTDESTQMKSVQPPTSVPYIPLKSNTQPPSEILNPEKDIVLEPDIDLKTPLNFYVPTSSIFPTVSWQNVKSSDLVDYQDFSKQKEHLKSLPTLSPSFIPSSISSEYDVLAKVISSVPSLPKLSNIYESTTILKSETPVTTPIFKSEVIPTVIDTDTVSDKEDEILKAVPPPRLTNPGCSSLPVCIEITLLESTWEEFCQQKQEFQEFLAKSVSHYTRPIRPYHIVLDTEVCSVSSALRAPQSSPDITVALYVTNDSGEYEERMTEICGLILRKWAPSTFKSSVLEVRFYNSEIPSTPLPIIPELNSGFVAAVSISAVAGVALCLLCILLVIMKQKLVQGRSSDTTTPTADAYSLDSLSISASFRRRRNRRSARSYLNHAFNDQDIPSHPLNEKSLANCVKSKDLLEEEFRRIPMTMPKLDSIPEGAHVKNRYSNILPKPESRVMLADPSGDPLKCYINANYVKGYEGKSAFYIACQAPLPEGIEDFWRMVWEQQSRVIVMLTMFEENGTSRCAVYFPQSTLISQQPFGDFQVSLLKKDVYEFYTLSTLRLLDLEKNLFRDVVHLWFTGWPDVGVPKDPTSLVTFTQQCRPYINCNAGPTIVHCSTGTGRTGVFLGIDICMREYDESRSIDILQCVSQLRRDRAGAVQNKDQYLLIHEAILEYANRVNNQSQRPSICN